MKHQRAYKTELDLNNKQKSLLNACFGGARFAYNWGLRNRIDLYENEKQSTDAMKQHKELNALKKDEFAWMYQYSKCIFQESLRDLDQAFKHFFRRCRSQKNGEKPGFPKFKTRHSSKQSFRLTGSIHVQSNKIKLPRIGWLKLKERGYIPEDCHIQNVTVSKRADRYFVSVSTIQEREAPVNDSTEVLGIDVGIKELAVCSDGQVFGNSKSLYKNEKKLKRVQREVSRRNKGSNNRKKSVKKLAQVHYRISNIRKDSLHKATTQIVRTKPSVIVLEDLSVKNMVKNHKLAKALSDASMSEFHRQIEYKSGWNSIEVFKVPRFFPSSKMCSRCGHIKEDLTLKDRVYVCECGLSIDRDLNAALNLKAFYEQNTVSSTGINDYGQNVSPVLQAAG